LSALALFVMPAARRTLAAAEYAAFLGELRRRLDPLSWFCLTILAGSGMIQLGVNPNYLGFLAITNRWAIAIFIKHILFLAMTALSLYLAWVVIPALQRTAFQLARRPPGEQEVPRLQSLQRQESLLLRLNLALGILILALTALARAS